MIDFFDSKPSIVAAYDGECARCDGSITAGVDRIERFDGGWAHVDCEAEPETSWPCPECHMVHAGECL